jgi:hypothetical protein
VSFNRPYRNPQRHLNGKGAGEFLSWEINMLRFLEREGYDTTYATNIDTHTTPAALLNHSAFLSVGHDKYYTKQMYDAVQAARDAGVNLGFFGAGMISWQIRLEPSIATGQPNRTVVGYKDATDPIATTDPTISGPMPSPGMRVAGMVRAAMGAHLSDRCRDFQPPAADILEPCARYWLR